MILSSATSSITGTMCCKKKMRKIILPWKNHSQFHELPSSSSECWQPKPSQGKLEKRPTKSCRFTTGPGYSGYTSMWIDFSQQKFSKVGYSNTKNTALFLKVASLKSWKCHFFPSICCALAGDIQFHHLDQRIQQSHPKEEPPTRQPEPIWVYHRGLLVKLCSSPFILWQMEEDETPARDRPRMES